MYLFGWSIRLGICVCILLLYVLRCLVRCLSCLSFCLFPEFLLKRCFLCEYIHVNQPLVFLRTYLHTSLLIAYCLLLCWLLVFSATVTYRGGVHRFRAWQAFVRRGSFLFCSAVCVCVYVPVFCFYWFVELKIKFVHFLLILLPV